MRDFQIDFKSTWNDEEKRMETRGEININGEWSYKDLIDLAMAAMTTVLNNLGKEIQKANQKIENNN